jgi:hypothetical protein
MIRFVLAGRSGSLTTECDIVATAGEIGFFSERLSKLGLVAKMDLKYKVPIGVKSKGEKNVGSRNS